MHGGESPSASGATAAQIGLGSGRYRWKCRCRLRADHVFAVCFRRIRTDSAMTALLAIVPVADIPFTTALLGTCPTHHQNDCSLHGFLAFPGATPVIFINTAYV